MVVAGPVADVRPRCARTVKSCSSWTLGSGRPGGRERLVVDRVVSLGVKVKHAGEAGGRLVGWKNGLQEHAEARKDARGGQEGQEEGVRGSYLHSRLRDGCPAAPDVAINTLQRLPGRGGRRRGGEEE